jgi:hypothetical protein
VTVREDILNGAADLICGDRAEMYGPIEINFARIAALWSVTLGIEVKQWQVALCMGQVKDARIIQSPRHWDSWVDRAGYTALGAEVAMDRCIHERDDA